MKLTIRKRPSGDIEAYLFFDGTGTMEAGQLDEARMLAYEIQKACESSENKNFNGRSSFHIKLPIVNISYETDHSLYE